MSAIDRRTFLAFASSSLAACALPNSAARTARSMSVHDFDLLIHGAQVFDGTGAPAQALDLALSGERIALVAPRGRIAPDRARRQLDASGLCLAPGFIDIHTHSDNDIFEYPGDESRIFQGITTEVTGNCGGSAAPHSDWNDVAGYFRALEERMVATNQILLVGQGTLRRSVAGLENRPLTAKELETLRRRLDTALAEGAAGLSSGLEYTPGRYSSTDELIALARVVQRRGGFYASHVRNEEAGLLESIDEALRIGHESGVRVQISHLKAAGRPNWPKQAGAIRAIEAAREQGLDVLFDVYPYTAYSTGLSIFLSDEVREGGFGAMLARFADPAQRARIRAELEPRIASDPGACELIVIASTSAADKTVVGRDLADIARERGVDGTEALLQLLDAAGGEVSFVGHAMDESNVVRALCHPLAFVSSDGYAMAPRGKALEKRPHPRSYGAFVRVLDRHVRQQGVLTLESALHKMTGMPAQQLRLSDRGRIAGGCMADLVLFDAATVREEASFEDPHRLASGFLHVFVNGVAVIRNGSATGARPGRALRSS